MSDIRELHREEYGVLPEIAVSAPGVVSLLGEHTEEHEGRAIQFAASHRVDVAISRRKDSSLRFYSASLRERKKTSIPNLKYRKEDRWANYLKGFYAQLLDWGAPPHGLEVTIYSTVKPQIGLASSSAMELAFAVALATLSGVHISEAQLIDLIQAGEEEYLGTVPRRVDFLTMFHAKRDHLVMVDTRTWETEVLPLGFPGTTFLLTDANVPEHILTEEYGGMDEEFEEFLTDFLREQGRRSLRDFSVEELRSSMGRIPEHVRRKALHVVEEFLRVEEARHALQRRDKVLFGRVLSRSHESLRDNYEVSCPEFDWIAKRCFEVPDVYGSRLVGTGLRGCIVTFLEERAVSLYRERVEEYERIFGFTADVYECRPSDGVEVIS
ncbi:GHMP kinase [Spirochaeta thermophila DSM 6578]|uniref:GHMP kinase n=1 Tax=Winmispira thermophila (strain ATCC 700085 / DSM 6578 / Z-1203) TaxID=869211 RepID=G0GBT6_WINT7|nr:galactokinase family protein [Spirochaeta thermophila]AEJ61164.1 GHMP kinase [Spirochaeta thermophila DSM 6578]